MFPQICALLRHVSDIMWPCLGSLCRIAHRIHKHIFPQSIILTYLLTPWCRVLLEKLTGFKLVKKFPSISRNPKVHYRTHKRPPPVSILGQPNPVHIPTSHILEIHPNIIHPSTPRSSQWSLSLRFPHQDPIQPPLLTPTRHMPKIRIVLSTEQASRMCVFLNITVLQGRVVSTSPNPQAGGPPLVGCPRLLIQFIRSYPPYRRPFLYLQPEDAPCRCDRDPLHGQSTIQLLNVKLSFVYKILRV